MANGHGGYRKPTNPAPVSGPGAHSRRTDGQPTMALPDAQYGEAASFAAAQQGAPMATDQVAQAQNGQFSMPPTVGLGAPTQEPDTPVTAGAAYGAGPGPQALGIQDPTQADAQYLGKYLPLLISVAERDDTPPGTKRFVRQLIASATS